MITLLKRKPTWQHKNMKTIITWHPYRLLDICNITSGSIYIHIHMFIYQTSPKHIPKTYTKISAQLENKKGYIARIWSTISHVASSSPKCFHCTLTCPIAWFQSMRIFLCKTYCGSCWNSPFGFTCNTYHSITWSTYLKYFLGNDTCKTSWTFIFGGSASR